MDPRGDRLRFYGQVGAVDALEWESVRAQLEAAGTYWVIGVSARHPHPRPVWGVWLDEGLAVSVGSQVLRRELTVDPTVTVHLDSGTDVVVVEGRVEEPPGEELMRSALAAYEAKYDWVYDVAQYGPLTWVAPSQVLAWRSAGWAGREGFARAGRWRFAPPA